MVDSNIVHLLEQRHDPPVLARRNLVLAYLSLAMCQLSVRDESALLENLRVRTFHELLQVRSIRPKFPMHS